MPSEAYNDVIFAGQYPRTVDEKNRLTIPADWRSGEEGVLFVRVHSSGSYITAQPPGELKKTVAELEARKDKTLAERQKMIRAVASGAQRCAVDKQGRMVLPPEFCAKAGLQGEVMLVGSFGRFEIWNAERWAAEAGNQDHAEELGL